MEIKEEKTIASEGGHWYDKSGNPCYEVEAAKGGMRPTTLRDARKMDLVPSVTTILKVLARPGLDVWLKSNLLMAAATLPRMDGESADDWIKRVEADSKEQSLAAMSLGTSIHSSLEKAYLGQPYDPAHETYVVQTMGAIKAMFPHENWKAEKSFAHAMGFGGKVDLHSRKVVIDFKTSAFSEDGKVGGYDEHLMQLAAYGRGVCDSNFRAANVYISTTAPGLVKIQEWSPEDIQRGWEMFKCALQFWKLKNKVD
jgi:hypothetical protein